MPTQAEAEQPVGTTEAAALFAVRPSNFIRDWASRPGFPAPIATLARGRLWSRGDLLAYRARSGPRRAANRGRLRLSREGERWLPTIKRRIVRRFRPERIVLFGSQARGEALDESDLDLLVVLSETEDPLAVRLAMRRALADLPVGTDIVVTTSGRIERYGDLVGTILRPALREGVTIYARS